MCSGIIVVVVARQMDPGPSAPPGGGTAGAFAVLDDGWTTVGDSLLAIRVIRSVWDTRGFPACLPTSPWQKYPKELYKTKYLSA